MTLAGMTLANIVAYVLQIGLVAGMGALVPRVLRMRVPRVRLLFWQMLLLACLALPFLRGWRREVVSGTAARIATNVTFGAAAASGPAHRSMPFPEAVLWILAAGVVIRLVWLAVGMVRLAAYRERSRPLPSAEEMNGVRLLLSEDVAGPVTFGWRDPVVLLPAGFPSLPNEIRDAILCHEMLHIDRRDWLFAMAEELVRAALWFHPAIWWVIGEIQLAREQTVDRAAIEMTQARGPYLDALLSMAGAGGALVAPQLDLAPAPMFLRRRHLRRRLNELMREAHMKISGTRLAITAGAAALMVAAACWLATGAFPLTAAPQVVNDAAGVAVNMNGTPLMHRAPVPYPAEALAKGVTGTVVVQVKLDANGEVSDATVLSGPDELRRGVLQSVLTWHFDRSAASSTRVVNIDFATPANPATTRAPDESAQLDRQLIQLKQRAESARGANMAPPPPPPAPPPAAGKLDRIVITGLSDSARADLLSRLPIQEGGEWTGDMFGSVKRAVSEFDSHLVVSLARSAGGELSLRVGVGSLALSAGGELSPRAGGGAAGGFGSASAIAPSGVYSVGNGTSPPVLLSKVDPVYPEQAGSDPGTVTLTIIVGTDGKAENVQVVKSLDDRFDANAIDAVSKWVFKPGMNNGVPVMVKATVEVNFRKL